MLDPIAVSHIVSGSSIGFWSTGFGTICILAIASIVTAIILGTGKMVMGIVRTRQARAKAEESGLSNFGKYFFDQPRDEQTGTPATVGWTTKVDATLEQLTKSQAHTTKILNEILYEVKPNGGGNLRAAIDEVRDRGDGPNA